VPRASLLWFLLNNWHIYGYTNPYQPGYVGHKSLILHDHLATNQKVACSSHAGRTKKLEKKSQKVTLLAFPNGSCQKCNLLILVD
jgi:hypothetical protein